MVEAQYLTLSSRSLHSLLTHHSPILTLRDNHFSTRMTTYCRPCPSPIDTLPLEILSHIFILATYTATSSSEESDSTPSFNAETVKSPLIIASVSRYWRRVALNTPRLWTSLCITMQMTRRVKDESSSRGNNSTATSLDTRHITNYLSLSRKYPLDVLIDARDYEWDFVEDGISPSSGPTSYNPPFSSQHMKTVLDLLLPHLSRWRSLSILTDTWAPMHAALKSLNAPITQHGAPLLESLTLMRCNDFVSFVPEFQPASLKSPYFLSNPKGPSSGSSSNILPRLRHLSLRGVHVDWTSLSIALSASDAGLHSMELGSHCLDVRPTASEFRHLLASSPSLKKLIVSGSGPSDPSHVTHSSTARKRSESSESSSSVSVTLPKLADLTFGYRTLSDAHCLLQMIDAENLMSLTVEDATHPADPDELDAGSILTYLGTGEFQTAKERYLANFDLIGGPMQYQAKPRKDSTSSIASAVTCVGASVEIDGRLHEEEQADDDDGSTLVEFDTRDQSPYPLLETVTLKGLKASHALPMSTFLGSLYHLRQLDISDMPITTIEALFPDPVDPRRLSLQGPEAGQASTSSTAPFSSGPPSVPCPRLSTLSLRNMSIHYDGLDLILNHLIAYRKSRGGCSLNDVDVHLAPDAPVASCEIELGGSMVSIRDAFEERDCVTFRKNGVLVNLFPSEFSYDDPMDEDEEDMYWEEELMARHGLAPDVMEPVDSRRQIAS